MGYIPCRKIQVPQFSINIVKHFFCDLSDFVMSHFLSMKYARYHLLNNSAKKLDINFLKNHSNCVMNYN